MLLDILFCIGVCLILELYFTYHENPNKTTLIKVNKKMSYLVSYLQIMYVQSNYKTIIDNETNVKYLI